MHILVSGASGDIGLKITQELIKSKYTISALYHTHRPCLTKEMKSISLFKGDMTNENDVERCMKEAIARNGPIHGLVCNHGIFPEKDVLIKDMDISQWNNTMNVNLTGYFLLCKHFLRQIKKEEIPPSIVLIGSTSGIFGERHHADYSASKAALKGFCLTLKNEIVLEHHLGRVNVIAPGWVHGKMAEGAIKENPELLQRVTKTMALRKIAKPSDVAKLTRFLIDSELSGHISGTIIPVSGGMEGRIVHQ